MLKYIEQPWRNVLEKFCSRTDFSNNIQSIHTPFTLADEMLDKLVEYGSPVDTHTYCVLNLEFVQLLIERDVLRSNMTFVTDCKEKAELCRRHPKFMGVNVVHDDYLSWDTKTMKFDVIVGNPPYQDSSGNIGNTLWDKFVLKSFDILTEHGYLCFLHPNGWRDVDGLFSEIKTTLLDKEIQYLEMHDMNDGVRVFGVQSNYDWYVLKNTSSTGKKTHIKGQDGSEYDVDISKLNFIPSRKFDDILSLLAKEGEASVEILHSYSSYEPRKEWMSEKRDNKYKYECIYSVKMGDIPSFRYSSTKDRGHFGIPKFIFGSGVCTSIGSIVDDKGEYGLTQWATGIVDIPKNLPLIKRAFDSPKFKELMKACPNQNNNINRKVLSLFRRDFWKEFI